MPDNVLDKTSISTGKYREIQPAILSGYQPFNTSNVLRINNFIWSNTPIRSGSTFLTSQGRRLVLTVNTSRVIYVLLDNIGGRKNRVFVQTAKGFINDVVMYPFEESGKKLQTIKRIAEYEIHVIIGILSVVNWSGFVSVAGVDATQFIFNNKKKIAYWPHLLQSCLKADASFKKYAPTLRNKLIYSTLLVALEGSEFALSHGGDIAGSLTQKAIQDEHVAGRAMGIITGKLSLQGLNGRLSAMSASWALLSTVASSTLSVIPGAASDVIKKTNSLAIQDKVAIGKELIVLLADSGISLNQREAEAIASEVLANPDKLVSTLTMLATTFNEYPK